MALFCIQMASSLHPVLLLGHSFVRRLSEDLRSQFDKRADENFKLSNDAIVHLHGVGGLTVRRLVQSKLGVVSSLSPHAVVLEISTKDLLPYGPRSLDQRSRNWFGCCSKLTPFELLLCARCYLVFERRFLSTLHKRSTSIFTEFWNPFQMFSVESIAVFLSHLRTLIYRTESM